MICIRKGWKVGRFTLKASEPREGVLQGWKVEGFTLKASELREGVLQGWKVEGLANRPANRITLEPFSDEIKRLDKFPKLNR